jgi:branched-chain amino acid transport system substrate-binding protein
LERSKLFSRSAVTKVQAVIVAVIIVVVVIAGATYYFVTIPPPTPTPTPATPTPATPTPATPTPATPTPATPPLTGQVLKVGLVVPLTGPNAPFGLQAKLGAEWAADEINAEGGILGAFVQVLVEDTGGDPKVAVTATEKLITVDRCQVIRAAFQSAAVLAAMEVTEKYEVPMLTIGASVDEITGKGYKYIFRVGPNSSMIAPEVINFVARYYKPKTIVIMHENSVFGTSHAQRLQEYIPKMHPEWQILAVEPYDAKGLDFKPLLQKVRELNPDCLIWVPYLTDAALILKQMAEMEYKPRYFVIGGTPDLSYIELLGEYGHYLINTCDYWPDRAYPNATLAYDLALKCWNKYQKPFAFQLTMAYLGMQILKEAVEYCKSLNPKDIANALRTAKMYIPWWGEVYFYPNGQIKFVELFAQIQPAKANEPWNCQRWTFHVIWPPPYNSTMPVFP